MLQNSYRYYSRFERLTKPKLRYIVLPIVVLAIFIIFANFGEDKEDTISTTGKQVASAYNNISPSAEEIVTNIGNKAMELQRTFTNIAKEQDSIVLSAEEVSLPVISISKPSKKPFVEIEEAQIITSLGDNATRKNLRVSKGDTLSKLLERGGVKATQAYNITVALQQLYNPKDMQIGQELSIITEKGTFKRLEIQKDLLHKIILNVMDDGRYGVVEREAPTKTVSFVKRGVIKSSLYKEALNQKMPNSLIVDMIRIYSWAVDFQRDIKSGDEFEIMYNMTLTEDNKVVSSASEITYVSLDLKNSEKITLYRYKDTQNDVGYYEETGRSVRKALMKTPINGARLSSGFGMRKHPVLGYSKMHKGIDFAASRGTPIYAAGDGRISYIGNKGGYGKYIRIHHHSGLATAYAHMSRFKKGLRKGSRVQQGKIIGYVGTTGRSTGPHLHYEILSNGRQINPRKLKIQKGKKLAGKELDIFKGVVEQTKYQFTELLEESIGNSQHAGLF